MINKKEINQKLYQYMIKYYAQQTNDFPCINHYISKTIQNELIMLKWHVLTAKNIDQYKKQIIPPSIPVIIKHRLQKEVNRLFEQRIKIARKQYITLVYQLTKIKNRRIKNICFLSGRSRAVYRIFHLSRLKIREHAQYGHFIGFKKISW